MLNIPGKTKTQGMVAELEIEGLWEMCMYIYIKPLFLNIILVPFSCQFKLLKPMK